MRPNSPPLASSPRTIALAERARRRHADRRQGRLSPRPHCDKVHPGRAGTDGIIGVRMMRILLAFCLLLALAPGMARADGDAPPIQPKVVLQVLPEGGIEAAAWTRDDKYLVIAVANSRAILIWDMERGHIIDRLTMPRDAFDARANNRILTGITADDDGNSVFFDGVAYPIEQLSQPPPVPFRFKLDLDTHKVTAQTPLSIDVAKYAEADPQMVRMALNDIYGGGGGVMTQEDLKKYLLPLPTSHDGKTKLERNSQGLTLIVGAPRIVSPPAGEVAAGAEPPPVAMVGPAIAQLYAPVVVNNGFSRLAPDGRRIAVSAGSNAEGTKSTFQFVTMVQDVQFADIELDGQYDELTWMRPDAVMVTRSAQRAMIDREFAESTKVPFVAGQPAVLVDLGAMIVDEIEARCIMAAASDRWVFGAGSAGCVPGDTANAGLQRYDIAKRVWEPFGPIALPPGVTISGISVAPSGFTVGVAYRNADAIVALATFDAENGTLVGARDFATPVSWGDMTLVDDFNMVLTDIAATTLYPMAIGDTRTDTRAFILDDKPIQMMLVAGNGAQVAIGDAAGSSIRLFDTETGTLTSTIDFNAPYGGGFLPDNGLFWAISPSEGLRFWSVGDMKPVADVLFPDPSVYLTVMPDGRYDTNVEADQPRFRWLMPDRLDQALAPQTFMRDYFQPGLLDKLLQCSAYGDCAEVVDKPKPIAELNRVLPEVMITAVDAGDTPDIARVSLTIREGHDPGARNGKTKSGVYNVQLFRENIFDSFVPDRDFDADALQDDVIEIWRDQNKLIDDDDKPGDGEYHQVIDVLLPTAKGTEKQHFSAYAFNSDRVKSETAFWEYTRPEVPARAPRAFVITIGIDAYDEPALRLDYAARDAELMGHQLGQIDGYAIHKLVVAGARGTRKAGGSAAPKVTAAMIGGILAILAGDTRPSAYAALKALGIDASMLDMATPDDIVIISFSGHGWADEFGDFYLVPAEGKLPDADGKGAETLIASWELTGWLRLIQAGQIALILDTCHSGASVRTERFRPGPMGDSGLAQLAYDKGIRILAATQADDVAYEDKRLKHGLLTYALAGPGEALSPKGVQRADSNGDGALDMDEWMSYAVARLPELNDNRNVTGLADDADALTARAFLFPNRKPQPAARIQQPTLFSYALAEPVRLRTAAPVASAGTDAATVETKTKVPVK